MKKILVTALFYLFSFINGNAQVERQIVPISLNDSLLLVSQLKPLLTELGRKKIIALGEGTHGTKEFNDVRIALMKELILKKGFKTIFFENPYGDTHYLNCMINSSDDIKSAMKLYMISLWQTKEILDFLYWIRRYNLTHTHKVSLIGMDFNYVANTAKIIKEELINHKQLAEKGRYVYQLACYQDSLWNKQNDPTSKFDFDIVLRNGYYAYKAVKEIDSTFKFEKVSISENLTNALLNAKHGFDMLYNGFLQKAGTSRDMCFAEMVDHIQKRKNTKGIIWVHAGHAAFKPVYKGDNGGGMGGILREKWGSDFYSIGTMTAYGTYSAIKDQVDTRDNKSYTYTLIKPLEDSWEKLLSTFKELNFFISFDKNNFKEKRKWRPLGYNAEDSKNYELEYTDKGFLKDYFDGVFFIRNSTASVHIHNQ